MSRVADLDPCDLYQMQAGEIRRKRLSFIGFLARETELTAQDRKYYAGLISACEDELEARGLELE